MNNNLIRIWIGSVMLPSIMHAPPKNDYAAKEIEAIRKEFTAFYSVPLNSNASAAAAAPISTGFSSSAAAASTSASAVAANSSAQSSSISPLTHEEIHKKFKANASARIWVALEAYKVRGGVFGFLLISLKEFKSRYGLFDFLLTSLSKYDENFNICCKIDCAIGYKFCDEYVKSYIEDAVRQTVRYVINNENTSARNISSQDQGYILSNFSRLQAMNEIGAKNACFLFNQILDLKNFITIYNNAKCSDENITNLLMNMIFRSNIYDFSARRKDPFLRFACFHFFNIYPMKINEVINNLDKNSRFYSDYVNIVECMLMEFIKLLREYSDKELSPYNLGIYMEHYKTKLDDIIDIVLKENLYFSNWMIILEEIRILGIDCNKINGEGRSYTSRIKYLHGHNPSNKSK